jgi:hypothetical protein
MMLLFDTAALFAGCPPVSAGVQHIDVDHGTDKNAITGVAAHSLVPPFNVFSHDLCSLCSAQPDNHPRRDEIAFITSRRGDLAAIMRDGIVSSMTTSDHFPFAGSLLTSASA